MKCFLTHQEKQEDQLYMDKSGDICTGCQSYRPTISRNRKKVCEIYTPSFGVSFETFSHHICPCTSCIVKAICTCDKINFSSSRICPIFNKIKWEILERCEEGGVRRYRLRRFHGVEEKLKTHYNEECKEGR